MFHFWRRLPSVKLKKRKHLSGRLLISPPWFPDHREPCAISVISARDQALVQSALNQGKRKANVSMADLLPKKVRMESPSSEVWYPSWDIYKGDYLFHLNEGGQFINMSAFDAFMLPRD